MRCFFGKKGDFDGFSSGLSGRKGFFLGVGDSEPSRFA